MVQVSLVHCLLGIATVTLHYLNTLGPTSVHISEKFIYVKYLCTLSLVSRPSVTEGLGTRLVYIIHVRVYIIMFFIQ